MQRQTKLFLTIAIAAVVLGILFRVLAGFFMQRASTTPNFNNTHTNFSRVTFVGTSPQLPATATIYNATVVKAPLEPFLTNLLSSAQFERNPYVDFIYHSAEGTLQVLEDDHQIIYTSNLATEAPQEEETQPSDIQESTAVAAATSFLSDVFGIPSQELHFTKIKYFLEHENASEANSTYARFAQLSFDQAIDGILIGTSFTGGELIRVSVDQEYSIFAVSFFPLDIQPTAVSTHPVIPIQEAVNNINNNQAFIANASWLSGGELSLSQITQARLTDVRLEYFASAVGDQELVPYYRFWGTATDGQGRELFVEIMTPAVDQGAEPIE